MKRILLVSALTSISLLWAQDPAAERITVPFSDPSKPRMVKANLLHGSISVKGYEGKDVIVEVRGRSGSQKRSAESQGLRRLDLHATGLIVEEQDNVVQIKAKDEPRRVDLFIQVPTNTSLNLKAVNSSKLEVDGVQGEVDVNSVNGLVTLTNISGAVVAHALNGKLVVVMDRVAPDKAMSFSTLNGPLDITLPEDVKATVKIKSGNGAVFTDFDITLDPSGRGERRASGDKSIYGTINGGGPEMQFTTLNGAIYLRKKK